MASPVTSPTSAATPAARRRSQMREFSKYLNVLYDYHRGITYLTELLAAFSFDPITVNIEDAETRAKLDGKPKIILNKPLLTALNRKYKEALTKITKQMVVEMTKRAQRAGTADGFKNPRVFSAEIVRFLQGAQLPNIQGDTPILQQVTFPQDNIATQRILANLFTVYAYWVADLPRYATTNQQKAAQGIKIDRQVMGIDEYMRDNLSQTLNTVLSQVGQLRPGGRGPDDVRKAFNPNDFRFANVQRIVAAARIPYTAVNPDTNQPIWTQNQIDKLIDPATGKPGMPADEKAAYINIVKPREIQVKAELEAREAMAKRTKPKGGLPEIQYPTMINYDVLGQQMATSLGRQLSEPTLTRLKMDKQAQLVTIYLRKVKAANR